VKKTKDRMANGTANGLSKKIRRVAGISKGRAKGKSARPLFIALALLLAIWAFVPGGTAFADSPITSTDFHRAYLDDYFEPHEAERLLLAAREKLNGSFTASIIHALVKDYMLLYKDGLMRNPFAAENRLVFRIGESSFTMNGYSHLRDPRYAAPVGTDTRAEDGRGAGADPLHR